MSQAWTVGSSPGGKPWPSAGTTTPLIDAPHAFLSVVVTRDRDRRRPGQEGFYHYRQYSSRQTSRPAASGRLAPPGPRHASGRPARRRLRRRDPPRCGCPRRSARPCRRSPGPAGSPARWRGCARPCPARRRPGLRPVYDIDAGRRRVDTVAACAAVPTLLAALYRLGRGLEPVEPREDLPYAANYLYMVTGSEPDPQRARAVEQHMISTIDHGFNASTFTARHRLHRRRCDGLPDRCRRRPVRPLARRRAQQGPGHARCDRHARPGSTPRSTNGYSPVTGSWASGHAVYRTEDPARACCGRSPSASAVRRCTSR